jgi:hypothetical protein
MKIELFFKKNLPQRTQRAQRKKVYQVIMGTGSGYQGFRITGGIGCSG